MCWKLELDARSTWYGCAVGFTGALGQLILFWALLKGTAYLIFPIICLSPVVTIVLSLVFLKERVHVFAGVGIVLSLIAIFLLSLDDTDAGPVSGYGWLFLAVLVFLLVFFVERRQPGYPLGTTRSGPVSWEAGPPSKQ